MVEVYLNPDNDAVWEEKENADTPEGREAVNTARSLLSQVRRSRKASHPVSLDGVWVVAGDTGGRDARSPTLLALGAV